MDDVVAVDKTTLRIKLKTESPGFMRLSRLRLGQQGAHDVQGGLRQERRGVVQRNAVGTGPFKFKQWIADDRVICEKNPDYYRERRRRQAAALPG